MSFDCSPVSGLRCWAVDLIPATLSQFLPIGFRRRLASRWWLPSGLARMSVATHAWGSGIRCVGAPLTSIWLGPHCHRTLDNERRMLVIIEPCRMPWMYDPARCIECSRWTSGLSECVYAWLPLWVAQIVAQPGRRTLRRPRLVDLLTSSGP